MAVFKLTKYAEKNLRKLPKNIQSRIIKKLYLLKQHPNIISVMKQVADLKPATHRFRIGSYRILCELISQKGGNFKFLILKIGHRKNIYQP